MWFYSLVLEVISKWTSIEIYSRRNLGFRKTTLLFTFGEHQIPYYEIVLRPVELDKLIRPWSFAKIFRTVCTLHRDNKTATRQTSVSINESPPQVNKKSVPAVTMYSERAKMLGFPIFKVLFGYQLAAAFLQIERHSRRQISPSHTFVPQLKPRCSFAMHASFISDHDLLPAMSQIPAASGKETHIGGTRIGEPSNGTLK